MFKIYSLFQCNLNMTGTSIWNRTLHLNKHDRQHINVYRTAFNSILHTFLVKIRNKCWQIIRQFFRPWNLKYRQVVMWTLQWCPPGKGERFTPTIQHLLKLLQICEMWNQHTLSLKKGSHRGWSNSQKLKAVVLAWVWVYRSHIKTTGLSVLGIPEMHWTSL